MATYQIGNRKTTFTPSEGNATYILGKGKTIEGYDSGIVQSAGIDRLTLEIAGKIKTTEDAVRIGDDMSPATDLSITVLESGRVKTESYGLGIHATGYEIENLGTIEGANGIRVVGSDGKIVNGGTVTGHTVGIVASGEVAIRNDGQITGGQYGIVVNATESGAGTIRNSGTIEGSQAALFGSIDDDRFSNTGILKGDVALRDGADVFVFKSGKVTGDIRGGEGDDRYVIGEENAKLEEHNGEGYDLVRASVSFTLSENIEQLNLTGKADIDGTGNGGDNHLQGNAGRNVLRGEAGVDFLLGLAGNDRLFGGEDADVFNFQEGSGRDVVEDFVAGIDEVQVGGLKGATSFDDMMANHVDKKGADLWITYGADVVVLKDTTKAELQEADFVF